MAQTPDTDSLYTQVRNTSGARRFFGYLSSHGKYLDDGEVYLQRGDLNAALANKPRVHNSFLADLENGTLMIERTPVVVLQDITDAVSKELALDNGVLGLVDPSWDEDGSSVFVAGDGTGDIGSSSSS